MQLSGLDPEKKLICFIDDSRQERELFEEVFGGKEGAFRVICAENFIQAKANLDQMDESPDLFVLDLYFPGNEKPAKTKIDPNAKPEFIDDQGDLTKAFLNLESARKRYQALRIARGQSPEGGLKLIGDVQAAFPCIPIVTYTRKGTIEEAESARKAGARRVLQKPSGEDWEQTGKITVEKRAELEEAFRQTMTIDPHDVLSMITHYSHLMDPDNDHHQLAVRVEEFRDRLKDHDLQDLDPSEIDQLMETSQHPFIRALIYQLRPEFPTHALKNAQGDSE